MWNVILPHWEFVLRAAIIYAVLLVLLRFTGKRQVGQLAPFDLVLLLILSNAVQNSMNGGDNSVTAGIILAVTLVTLNWIAGWATFRSKRMEVIIEGRPIVLVHDGHVEMEGLRKAQMTMHELNASLRAEGHSTTDDVLVAMLENNGRVTVVPRRKSEKP